MQCAGVGKNFFFGRKVPGGRIKSFFSTKTSLGVEKKSFLAPKVSGGRKKTFFHHLPDCFFAICYLILRVMMVRAAKIIVIMRKRIVILLS